MKPGKLIALTTLAIALTAWGVTAYEPQTGNEFFYGSHQGMMQEQLDLTDEQADAVQEILVDGQETLTILFEHHGLEYKNVRRMRREMVKFRQQNLKKLTTILNEEQFQILHQEIFNNGPLAFMLLPEEERIVHMQELLGLSDEDACLVAAILEDGEGQRDNLLDNAGVNPIEMEVLRQDMASRREELKESLREILNDEQMEQVDEFSSRMKLWNRGYGVPFMNQGER